MAKCRECGGTGETVNLCIEIPCFACDKTGKIPDTKETAQLAEMVEVRFKIERYSLEKTLEKIKYHGGKIISTTTI